MQNLLSDVDSELLKKLPVQMATRWKVLPLSGGDKGVIRLAVVNAHDLEMLENLRVLLGAPVEASEIWSPAQIDQAIETHYGIGAGEIDELHQDSPEKMDTAEFHDSGNGAMARFVDDLIRQAQQAQATDIHIEPFDNELVIRFRVDGLLHAVPVPPTLTRFQALLCSRIKIMAEMNIAEKRLPQDGRLRFRDTEGDLDIRVSTIPTMNGESIDLRLLPKTRLILGLEELGMAKDHRDTMASLIKKPNGIILVTGPTGHGKTTTLYSCLSAINTIEKKIITIEDPVEVRLRGINQIQVHSKIGLTFANGLRSILRQDPDVVMVGEVRDSDTADIAIRASLTGHLVFSTLHTNDAVGAITRLTDMGIEPYLVASSLHAILAQRLIRLLCPICHGSTGGCSHCRHTGFRGRTGIFELLVINDDIRQLILNRTSPLEIRRKATAIGMRTMFQDGGIKVVGGLTTTTEILRVTEETE